MWQFLYPVCTLVLTATVGSTYLWYRKPGILLRQLMRLSLYIRGGRIRYVHGKRYRYCYAERGTRQAGIPTIVLVHGFSSSKDQWIPLLQQLPRDRHVVVVDLPGHGDTTMPTDEDNISIIQLAQDLHEFTSAAGLTENTFHLVGTSLGGALVALYASFFPEDIHCLTLICPAMKTPISTKFMEECERGFCSLIPETVEKMESMLNMCMYKDINLSKQLILGILQTRLPRNYFWQKLFEEINSVSNHDELLENLCKIKAPTQVIWGQEDQLVHISGIEVLKKYLHHLQRVDIFDECGHSVAMERPGLLTKSLLQFRQEIGADAPIASANGAVGRGTCKKHE